jgi:hypothetical protein
MPISAIIARIDLVPPSRANTSKNLHLLVVVASLPARGSGDGVRKGFERVGGAIISCLERWLLMDESREFAFWCFWPVRTEF